VGGSIALPAKSRTEPRERLHRIEGRAADSALLLNCDALRPSRFAMFGMPPSAFFGGMPLGGEGTDGGQMLAMLRCPLQFGVLFAMQVRRQANKIRDVIVKRIFVGVVDDVTIRYLTEVSAPYLPVEQVRTPRYIARLVVDPMRSLPRVRVSPVNTALEFDRFVVPIATAHSSSPSCSRAAGTKPLPSTHTG